VCGRCRRPTSVCYCAALPALDTATRIVILQHPRERDMPIGTARMATLCLPRATLHVGIDWSTHAPLAAVLASPSHPPILLYPGPGARDILREPPPTPVTLVVVDGTWSQARNVIRDNAVLRALPRYAFAPPEPSHYRIRREPTAECVSTIEALMHVLGVLESDPARFRALLAPLRAMIDAHLAHRSHTAPGPQPRRRLRPRPRSHLPRIPPALRDRWPDIVCVVGEANAWPYRDRDHRDLPDELVHLLAHRPATNETFHAICAPELPLSPSTTFHTELPEATLLSAPPRAALLAAFARFLRPTDILTCWGHYSPSLLPAPHTHERLDMRAASQRLTNAKLGSLEDYAATVGQTLPPTLPGRGGRRLAALVQIVEWGRFQLLQPAARK
jgi:tRNA-uridine aminocarboxypropyltransferase